MDVDAVRSWYDRGGKYSKGKGKGAKGKVKYDNDKTKGTGKDDKVKSKAVKTTSGATGVRWQDT
eukprot:3899348-Pyramimonas_sp.AAC.1